MGEGGFWYQYSGTKDRGKVSICDFGETGVCVVKHIFFFFFFCRMFLLVMRSSCHHEGFSRYEEIEELGS